MARRSLAFALALLLPLAGCAATEDPVWKLDPDAHLVVLPFQDPDFAHRWDSPAGHDAANETTTALTRVVEFGVRPYEDVTALVASEDTDRLQPADVAARLDADYILVCDFELLRLDERNVNFEQGRARVLVRLFRASEARFVPAAQRTVDVVHPTEVEPFLEPSDVRDGLMRAVGEAVARLYHEHPAERGSPGY